jgi:hypothetical protein
VLAPSTPNRSPDPTQPNPTQPASHRGPVGIALSMGGALWSAVTAAKVLGRLSPALQEVRSLLIYPCLLMYSSFALLGVY